MAATPDRFDLAILGGGSAAFAAAIKASELGVKVAMVESGTIGGTCVNVGCVPSKHLLHVGEIYYYAEKTSLRGFKLTRRFLDFPAIIRQKDRVVHLLRQSRYENVLEALPNVTLFKGRAVFIGDHDVKAGDRQIRADRYIVATGSSPQILQIKGIEEVGYLTSDEALSLSKLPRSMVIIGGRALALEFAQMYAHFGTRVIVLQRSPRILPDEEPEISEALRIYLEREGIEIHTGVKIEAVKKTGRFKTIFARVGPRARRFRAEQILMATGRRPNTDNLGLERAGVAVGRDGAVLVNEEMQTSAPHVWAAGDVLGKPMLETVAAKEGAIAAENALTGAGKKMDFTAVPHAVFTSPQVASVGLTEEEAAQKYGACSCRVLEMELVPKAVAVKDTRGLIKMVVDPTTGAIVGVHLLAPMAADIVHEAVLAVKYKLTVDDIIDTVHVFPTVAESIKLVATAFRKDVSKLSCCVE